MAHGFTFSHSPTELAWMTACDPAGKLFHHFQGPFGITLPSDVRSLTTEDRRSWLFGAGPLSSEYLQRFQFSALTLHWHAEVPPVCHWRLKQISGIYSRHFDRDVSRVKVCIIGWAYLSCAPCGGRAVPFRSRLQRVGALRLFLPGASPIAHWDSNPGVTGVRVLVC